MSTMDHAVRHKNKGASFPFFVKGALSMAMLTLILVGAGFYLVGSRYTQDLQAAAVLIGGVVGVCSAYLVNKLSSDH